MIEPFEEWASSWLDFFAVCLLAKDCNPGFFKKQALLLMTIDLREQITMSLMRFIFLETLLRVIQMTLSLGCIMIVKEVTQSYGYHKRRHIASAFKVISYITMILTFLEVFYYAKEFNQMPSLLVDRHKQQLMSFAMSLLSFVIVIVLRFVIRGFIGLIEVVLITVQNGLLRQQRGSRELLPK